MYLQKRRSFNNYLVNLLTKIIIKLSPLRLLRNCHATSVLIRALLLPLIVSLATPVPGDLKEYTCMTLLRCYSATNQNIMIIGQNKPKGLRMSEIVSDNNRDNKRGERAEQQQTCKL